MKLIRLDKLYVIYYYLFWSPLMIEKLGFKFYDSENPIFNLFLYENI